MEEQSRRETCLLYTFILFPEVKTLVEKWGFSFNENLDMFSQTNILIVSNANKT